MSRYLASDREAEIDRLIVEAYTRRPQATDDLRFSDAATRAMLVNHEPWDPPAREQEDGQG